jgi:hypothetical protein
VKEGQVDNDFLALMNDADLADALGASFPLGKGPDYRVLRSGNNHTVWNVGFGSRDHAMLSEPSSDQTRTIPTTPAVSVDIDLGSSLPDDFFSAFALDADAAIAASEALWRR